jgi:hypothetical protein
MLKVKRIENRNHTLAVGDFLAPRKLRKAG